MAMCANMLLAWAQGSSWGFDRICALQSGGQKQDTRVSSAVDLNMTDLGRGEMAANEGFCLGTVPCGRLLRAHVSQADKSAASQCSTLCRVRRRPRWRKS